ncbi:MAG: hypothetical protein PHX83_06250 [Acidobacteriia bacterium]|nr:hypothetical protein [Terriglobia bacterium]
MEIDDTLKERIQGLGAALSTALTESPGIAEAIGSIRERGYEVALVLEATIGLSRNSGEASTLPEESHPGGKTEEMEIKFTASDRQFLRSLRIKLDEGARTDLSGTKNE